MTNTKLRWLWFCLGTTLALTCTLVAGRLAVIHRWDEVAKERKAVEAIRSLHGRVLYDYEWDKILGWEQLSSDPTHNYNETFFHGLVRRVFGDDFACSRIVDLRGQTVRQSELSTLVQLHNVDRLNLQQTTLSESGIELLEKLPLVELNLGGSSITDEGMKYIGQCRRLTSLNLDGTRITDLGLKYISDLKQLQVLILSGTAISNEGLLVVCGLGNLRVLVLGNGLFTSDQMTTITDAGLSCLLTLQHLECLALHGLPITDDGVREISKVGSLRALYLDGTRVTDGGLKYIESLRGLQVLGIEGTSISPVGIATVLKKMPSLGIAPDHGPLGSEYYWYEASVQ